MTTTPEIKDGTLVIGDHQITIPPALLVNAAFTKNGAIDGRSHAGKALKGWIAEQTSPNFAKEGIDAPQEPAGGMLTTDSTQVAQGATKASPEASGGVSVTAPPSSEPTPAEPLTEKTPAQPAAFPRLGSHESSKNLVDVIVGMYPDAKPNDWRTVQAMLQNATRYGVHWSQQTRKG